MGGLAIFTLLFGSCKITDTSVVSGPIVHMGQTTFLKPAITIKKGDKLLLIDNVNSLHIIKNGTWQGTVQKTGIEPGAPTVSQTFSGNDRASIGPFTQAGLFQLYCTVHQGMNLAVTVQ
jgi:plastocyanin